MKGIGAVKRGGPSPVNRVRGVLMLVAAALAFWQGWRLHAGRSAALAYGLGAAALALAIWHFARTPPRPRV